MADYMSLISFAVRVPADRHEWFVRYVAAHEDHDDDDYVDADISFSGDLVHFKTDDLSVNLGGLVAMLQAYLIDLEPEGCIGFEVSYSCNHARLDAYGGAAFFITAKKVTQTHTSSWLSKARQRAETARKPLRWLNQDP